MHVADRMAMVPGDLATTIAAYGPLIKGQVLGERVR